MNDLLAAKKKTLFDFCSTQEVGKNFSVTELLREARENNLSEWLNVNFYSPEAKKINDAVEKNLSDVELEIIICEIFGLNFDMLSGDDLDEISAFVAKRQEREIFSDGRDDWQSAAFVTDQRELIRALRDDAKVIYLIGGQYRIPLELNDKLYIGRENAVVELLVDGNIDLDARNIIFEDVQIFLPNPVTLKADQSKNLKILDGSKKILDGQPTLKEIFDIMRGRRAFESPENFARRAETVQGAAVGTVVLDDENYFYDEQKFRLAPQWNLDFVTVLRDFADKNFFVTLAPENAEKLYCNERMLQIFADLTAEGKSPKILRLYLETETLGRIFINVVAKRISSGGGGVLGYGLELIAAFKNEVTA